MLLNGCAGKLWLCQRQPFGIIFVVACLDRCTAARGSTCVCPRSMSSRTAGEGSSVAYGG